MGLSSTADQKPVSIIGTGCSTATGETVSGFVSALHSGLDALVPVSTETWKVAPKPGFEPRAFRWANNDRSSIRKLLGEKLLQVFKEASSGLPSGSLQRDRIGVVLASTKGFTEDFVWNESSGSSSGSGSSDFDIDPLTPLLTDFVQAAGLIPARKVCVSNACASSLAALYVARTWLHADRVDHVVVLACDAIDSFVLHGFHQLRVLSPDRTRPFSGVRTGFHLGDAAACVVLSKKIQSSVHLLDARIDSEGHAATRPSHSGDSLLRAARSLESLNLNPPELVIAHGTSTQANDVTEDRVFTALFAETPKKPVITGTKWSVGHTLGAAGLLDVIAAVEVLKTQKAFPIFTTAEVDSTFQNQYLVQNTAQKFALNPESAFQRATTINRIMVTSLGFGGVHAAALVGLA